jgi:hypothetical protein
MARTDVSRFLAIVDFDREKMTLRSPVLLEYQLVENVPNDFEEALHSPTRTADQKCLYVRNGTVFDVEDAGIALIQLENVLGYGAIGVFLSLWDAAGDSLHFRCIGEDLFGDSFGTTELVASRTAGDAVFVLSIFGAGDGGDAWGALRVHKVGDDCRHERRFEETWEAQYMSGRPWVEYVFLEQASTERSFVVDRREFLIRRDKADREEKLLSGSRRLTIGLAE